MPTSAARRPSLCLFCDFASRRRPRPRRFLPNVQVAHQTWGPLRKAKQGEQGDDHGRDIGEGTRIRFTGLRPKASTPHDVVKRSLRGNSTPAAIFETIRERLYPLRIQLETPEYMKSLDLAPKQFEKEWDKFERSVGLWIKKGSEEINLLAQDVRRGSTTIEMRLRYLFHAQVIGQRFTQAELENQKELADLQWPSEWYPATREISRTVHLHVGPTNSGKTYHALKRLEQAETGIYLGPLRLLAHEVYSRLNAKGKSCALVTGEEQRMPHGEKSEMFSCTVEMAPLNKDFEVAVIDEIQMINHKDRGWAWTQAFLGIKASEIHVCGEARTVPLIRELCALVGDKVEVHDYERLTPLRVAPRSLNGNLDRLQKGDCVVVFSVLGIHALRRRIEKKTGRKCAMVYGSLPPETRAQQARLFNDPDNDYDFLVASDAIGMGLNLAVKRIIFESTVKNNGAKLMPLPISEIKQIAGRAGRYRTAHQAVKEGLNEDADSADETAIGLEAPPKAQNTTVGLVTTLEAYDHAYLRSCMEKEPEPIKTAGLFPPSLIVERFSNYFPPGTPFSYVLLRLHEISNIHPRFHLCSLKDQLVIADTIHEIRNLSIQERLTFCAAPSNVREVIEKDFLRALARCVADNESGNLLDLDHLPLEVLDEPMSAERSYLKSLEQLHKLLVVYLWLSYRFPNVFTTRALANHVKQLVEDKIEQTLLNFNYTENAQRTITKKRREAIRKLEISNEGNIEAADAEGQLADLVRGNLGTQEAKNDPLDQDDEPHDDAEEYLTPEVEDVGSRVEDIAARQERHSKQMRDLAQQIGKATKRPVPGIDLNSPSPNSTQPGV